jgi:hypothetical protein
MPAQWTAHRPFWHGNVVNALLAMKNERLSEYTVHFVSKALEFLGKHADKKVEASSIF